MSQQRAACQDFLVMKRPFFLGAKHLAVVAWTSRMRSHDTPRDCDEWPNLDEVDRPQPARFPDGELVTPLDDEEIIPPTRLAASLVIGILLLSFLASLGGG